jgi:anti-anti-sigma factor
MSDPSAGEPPGVPGWAGSESTPEAGSGAGSGPGSGAGSGAGPAPTRAASSDLARVDIQDHDGVHVAAITGEVDISNVDDVTRRLIALPNFAPGLVVDLRLVTYMDSTGISMLHDLAGRLRERSQKLIVVCPPGSPPRRVLELTGLIARTTVVDDLAPAVQTLRHVAQDLPSS